ncbi:peptidoglycan-binding domain-containing protein [Alicyclobacillus acidoterrestris]|uniref:peptidoglycan-binding domain-containing protein n=1 Tax=Alicyclobacillus acidoterrestris TaxID=1450 RepID=UPI003F534D04
MNFKKLLAASSVPMLLTVAAPVAVYAQTEPTISYGSVGSAVTTLQKDLKSLGYSVGPIDGDFGPKTLSAVKSFQQAHKLTVDGVVGPQTWSALQSATHGASFTNVDLRYSAPSDINTKTINSFLSERFAELTFTTHLTLYIVFH